MDWSSLEQNPQRWQEYLTDLGNCSLKTMQSKTSLSPFSTTSGADPVMSSFRVSRSSLMSLDEQSASRSSIRRLRH